jgi:hypothetical protein
MVYFNENFRLVQNLTLLKITLKALPYKFADIM